MKQIDGISYKEIDKRIDKLQRDSAYYHKPRRFPVQFSDVAHAYYKSIPNRLDELGELIKI